MLDLWPPEKLEILVLLDHAVFLSVGEEVDLIAELWWAMESIYRA